MAEETETQKVQTPCWFCGAVNCEGHSEEELMWDSLEWD